MRLELHFIPNIEYFTLLNRFPEIHLDTGEFYQKQSYRNRCYIQSANKIQILTVPIKGGNKKVKTKDIQIDYQQKWLNVHLRAIQSSYGKAPFFEFYFDYFYNIYVKKEKFLVDLNFQMLSLCLKLLQIDSKINLVENFGELNYQVDNQFFNQINRKESAVSRHLFQPVEYHQLFGNKFVPNLSILDLLFCEGPNAREVVNQSTLSDH